MQFKNIHVFSYNKKRELNYFVPSLNSTLCHCGDLQSSQISEALFREARPAGRGRQTEYVAQLTVQILK